MGRESEEHLATDPGQPPLQAALGALGSLAAEAPTVQRMRDVGPS